VKPAWIILALSVATGIAAVQPCRRFTLREHDKAVNAHKLSKDRVAAIVAWNKEHPEWVKRWRAEHIIHDTEVLLCPEPTLDQELTELLPEEPMVTFDDMSMLVIPEWGPAYPPKPPEIPTEYPPNNDTIAYAAPIIPAGFIAPYVPSVGTAATPESRTWVLLVIGIIVGVSYIQSFRSLR
jgi:hypothetical protein